MTWTVIALVWCVVGAVCTFFSARNRSNRRALRVMSGILCVLSAAAVVLNGFVLARLIQ